MRVKRLRVKLVRGVSFWTSDDSDVWICVDRLSKYFHIPREIDDITVVLSSARTSAHEYCVSEGPCPECSVTIWHADGPTDEAVIACAVATARRAIADGLCWLSIEIPKEPE